MHGFGLVRRQIWLEKEKRIELGQVFHNVDTLLEKDAWLDRRSCTPAGILTVASNRACFIFASDNSNALPELFR